MPRSPDRDDEPVASDVGQGYPEENQPGAGAGAHTQQRDDDQSDGGGSDSARTSTAEDGDPGQATGNPRAAGGDGR